MLFHLVMPYYNPSIPALSVVQWLKREGERIEAGDELLLVRVDHIHVPRESLGWNRKQIERTIKAQQAWGPLETSDVRLASRNQKMRNVKIRADYCCRILAAEPGWLRKIVAQEGDERKVGELLAILATDSQEPLVEAGGTGVVKSAAPIATISRRLLSKWAEGIATIFRNRGGVGQSVPASGPVGPAPGRISHFRVVSSRYIPLMDR